MPRVMTLPEPIERALQDVEAEYAQPGRLRGLRAAIEAALQHQPDQAPAPCVCCGTSASADGDWYRICGPCRWDYSYDSPTGDAR